MNIDFALEFEQPGLAQARKILAEKLNIHINLHEHNELSFADLLEPRHCAMVLGEFQSRIQALNLTCSGSMFIKYWAVPLLFPYLYALLTEQLNLSWQLSALSVQMAPTWSWDQHLNFKASSLSLTALSTQNSGYEAFMLKIFGLKHNPFLLLQHSSQSSLENYQRKKCCFYFQLPEAENEYCGSCPLANKHP